MVIEAERSYIRAKKVRLKIEQIQYTTSKQALNALPCIGRQMSKCDKGYKKSF